MFGAGNNKQVRVLSATTGVTLALTIQQFASLADKILGSPELASDPRFSTNSSRVANREELRAMITEVLVTQDRDYWLKKFAGLG